MLKLLTSCGLDGFVTSVIFTTEVALSDVYRKRCSDGVPGLMRWIEIV